MKPKGFGKLQSSFGSLGMNDGELNLPQSIATTKGYNVCIADTANERIQVFRLE